MTAYFMIGKLSFSILEMQKKMRTIREITCPHQMKQNFVQVCHDKKRQIIPKNAVCWGQQYAQGTMTRHAQEFDA